MQELPYQRDMLASQQAQCICKKLQNLTLSSWRVLAGRERNLPDIYPHRTLIWKEKKRACSCGWLSDIYIICPSLTSCHAFMPFFFLVSRCHASVSSQYSAEHPTCTTRPGLAWYKDCFFCYSRFCWWPDLQGKHLPKCSTSSSLRSLLSVII